MNWTPFLWLAVSLGVLLLVERWIHRHLQGTMLLLTGDPEIALVLYALPLLPGIVLHELSHALAAVLLGARVGGISIRPKLAGQRVQLGFVPVEKTDAVRASLIGLAPLLIGSGFILLVGCLAFDIPTVAAALTTGHLLDAVRGIGRMLDAPDTWIWAYAIFTVSNTMLPSRADRQAWRPVILFLLLIVVLIWVAGLGPAIVEATATTIIAGLHWLAMICALTVVVDVPFALAVALTEKLLERLKGWKVDYLT